MPLHGVAPRAARLDRGEHNRLINETRVNTRLDLDSRFFAKSQNAAKHAFTFLPENLPRAMFYARVTWAASASAYDWHSVFYDGAGTFADDAGGPSSAGASSGSNSEPLATHEGGATDLPDDLIVVMARVLADDDSEHYTFRVASELAGSRATIGTGGGAGSKETADTDTWDLSSQGASVGIEVSVCTAVGYNHAATTPRLYGFERTLTFDAGGRLVDVSAETRFTIDEPDDC